jgi:hypothetical protein
VAVVVSIAFATSVSDEVEVVDVGKATASSQAQWEILVYKKPTGFKVKITTYNREIGLIPLKIVIITIPNLNEIFFASNVSKSEKTKLIVINEKEEKLLKSYTWFSSQQNYFHWILVNLKKISGIKINVNVPKTEAKDNEYSRI